MRQTPRLAPVLAALFAGLLAFPATAQETGCDRLAGIPGIARPGAADSAGRYAVTDPAAAVAACEAALAASPDDAFLAVLLARALSAADPQDARAVALLSGASEALPALAGAALGRLYENGAGGLRLDPRPARDFYRLACDAWPERQAAPGCTGYALMLIEGRGGPVDEAGGFALLGNLCRGGWGPACTQAAFQSDLRGDATPEAVAALFDAGCAAGDLLGCSQYGYRLEQGFGAPLEPAHAADLYRRACDGGEPQGCSYLGEIYRSGLGVRPDMAEAARLFAQGCAGDDPYACVTLADMLDQGRGVARDAARAQALFEHACTLGDPEACDRLEF